jgi:hypothetical protein
MQDFDFMSNEQKVVVEYRKSTGYKVEKLPNGYWLCYKEKHKMIINGCGWDTYIGVGNA